jgi:hypothetical protein
MSFLTAELLKDSGTVNTPLSDSGTMPVFKKILKSQRGGKILIDQEGYLYNYLRETGTSMWL